MRNLFAVSFEAAIRGARVDIHLKVAPEERVSTATGKGHYLWLAESWAQIIAVDDYRPSAGTYNDLIPGFCLVEVVHLPFGSDVSIDNPVRQRSFVALNYFSNSRQRLVESGD